MKYRRYQHLEKYGTQATQGIEAGTIYVFPKIDGTNAQTFIDDEVVQAGSRNRLLDESAKGDNAGFCKWARSDARIQAFHVKYPKLRLYGEWLVPHSLKTYRDDAWKRFYVFDVIEEQADGSGENDYRYLSYDEYKPLMDEFHIDYIPPIAIIRNPTVDSIYHCLTRNGFLVKDGEGDGEGIVIKNYDFVNKYGRRTWAKIVTNEFKEKHAKEMGAPTLDPQKLIEDKIVDEFVTAALVEKEYSKIVNECGEWSNKLIPRLLNTVFYSLVDEETWNFVKKYKNPSINFGMLQRLTILKVKATMPQLF